MMSSQSPTVGRQLLCGAVVLLLGCTSTVDHLGYNKAGPALAEAGSGQAGSASGGFAQGGFAQAGSAQGGSAQGGSAQGGSVPIKPFKTVLGAMSCSGTNTSGYRDVGRSQAAIDEKLDAAFSQLFHGAKDTQAIYFHVDTDKDHAVIRDVLHDNQVRTEGMGLGMLIAAMLERRDEFDRLWRYASTYLEYQSGLLRGYFRSYCDNGPTEDSTGSDAKFRTCADPYGLQQFVMALLLARQRWLPAANMPDYGSEAARLFDAMRNKQRDDLAAVAGGAGGSLSGGTAGTATTSVVMAGAGALAAGTAGAQGVGGASSSSAPASGSSTGASSSSVVATTSPSMGGTSNSSGKSTTSSVDVGANTFDIATKLIYDDPASSGRTTTATALLMPGYYTVWAQVTGDPFYVQAAEQSRLFLKRVAHPKTGLVPVRAHFDGAPLDGWGDYTPEAHRTLINLAIDRILGTSDAWQNAQIQAMLDFLNSQGSSYGSAFSLDGKSVIIADHQPEIILVAGVIAAISNHPKRKDFINAAWDVAIPSGDSRYYPGLLYLVSNLILGGRFRLCP